MVSAISAEHPAKSFERESNGKKLTSLKSRPGRKRDDPPAIAAARAGRADILQDMDPDEVRGAIDHNGCGCLHWAAGNGDLELCRFLVEGLGIDVHVETWNQRTPLHYAARNGQLQICCWLVVDAGAAAERYARDEVTPFQLAVWQNHLDCCRWLVEEAGVKAQQKNKFGCTVAHWLSQAPKERAGSPQGAALLPTADWLLSCGVDFSMTQEHGHTALHKAAWSGHLELCKWLRDICGLRDSLQDEAGNFAADLADMNGHAEVTEWLRAECSLARAASCRVLGVADDADEATLRAAFLQRVRETHPDRCKYQHDQPTPQSNFDAIHRAYRHLTVEGGRGCQHNPRHKHMLMLLDAPQALNKDLSLDHQSTEVQSDCGAQKSDVCCSGEAASGTAAGPEEALGLFKMRLLTIIREFGTKGFPVSSLRKKYAQVWDGADVPPPSAFGIKKKKCGLLELVRLVAADVVRIEVLGNGQEPLLHATGTAAAVVAAPPPMIKTSSSCAIRPEGVDRVSLEPQECSDVRNMTCGPTSQPTVLVAS